MMHCSYADILAGRGDPLWWDEVAVPRYFAFHPEHAHNIYATRVALVEIACQDCGQRFLVAFSSARSFDLVNEVDPEWLVNDIRSGRLHYGDPPNAGCCPAGPTMNCEDLQVVEFWESETFDWKRRPELEGPLLDCREREDK